MQSLGKKSKKLPKIILVSVIISLAVASIMYSVISGSREPLTNMMEISLSREAALDSHQVIRSDSAAKKSNDFSVILDN